MKQSYHSHWIYGPRKAKTVFYFERVSYDVLDR